jgi:hypothetical protein
MSAAKAELAARAIREIPATVDKNNFLKFMIGSP